MRGGAHAGWGAILLRGSCQTQVQEQLRLASCYGATVAFLRLPYKERET